MVQTSDILVIGGGIAGIGAAARLSEEASVRVLEAEDAIGTHATGRSAAIFIRNYGNAVLRALNAASEPVMLEPEGLSERSILSPRGELLIANESERGDLEDYLAGAEGIERLSASEAVALCPILKEDQIVAAAYEADARDIDVDRLFQGFARLLKSRGGEVNVKSPVQEIAREHGVWRVKTPGGEFSAPILINAAGAWADTVAAMAGVQPIGLTPYRRSAVTIPTPDGYQIDQWPLFASAAEQWYAKPEAGTLMVSPADADPTDPHDAWADDMVIAEGLHRFVQAVTISVERILHTWAGLRTFAPDKTPVVGFDGAKDGFFWLAGQGGYGIQTAPAMSQLTADLILGRASSLSDETISALTPKRF